jgi:hypothetical protein
MECARDIEHWRSSTQGDGAGQRLHGGGERLLRGMKEAFA